MISKKDLFDLFESQERKHYKKRGRFLSRLAVQGETILTIVDGKLETLKVATKEDVILRNIEIGSSAETYIISKKKFEERYDDAFEHHTIDGQPWFVVIAKGEIEAFCFGHNITGTAALPEPIQFMAPWGEQMLCNPGDFLARPLPGDEFDIYRIEKKTFDLTYSLKE